MFTKTTIKDVQLENKNILIRTDFNVPIKDGQVQSDFRLQAAIPTLKYLKHLRNQLFLCNSMKYLQ